MRVLALETDIGKIKAPFLHEDERELLLVRRHGLQFFFRAIPYIAVFLAFLLGLAIVDTTYPFGAGLLLVLALDGLIGLVIGLLVLYANVRFDFIFFTIDKFVIVDSTILRQTIVPINLDSVTAVSTETQFWNIFPFGVLRIKAKDDAKTESARHMSKEDPDYFGTSDFIFTYTPHAPAVAARINEILTDFQRRKMNTAAPLLTESEQAQLRLAERRSVAERQADKVARELVPPSSKSKEEEDNEGKTAPEQEEERRKRRRLSTLESQARTRMLNFFP